MTYTHANYVSDIFRALGITVPEGAVDDLQMQAAVCLAEIESLRSAPKSVVVAVYEHKHGQDVRVFKDHAASAKWMEKIATEDWWEHYDTEPPENPTACATAYFEGLVNAPNPEFFTTHDETVEG